MDAPEGCQGFDLRGRTIKGKTMNEHNDEPTIGWTIDDHFAAWNIETYPNTERVADVIDELKRRSRTDTEAALKTWNDIQSVAREALDHLAATIGDRCADGVRIVVTNEGDHIRASVPTMPGLSATGTTFPDVMAAFAEAFDEYTRYYDQ